VNAYLWWYLPTVLRADGVPVEEIAALTSALALPWALKFLWAPAVDLLRGPRWGLRGWILSTQALMVLAFLPLLFLDLRADFAAVAAFLLAHAFAASLQDVAVDALAIGATPEEERGSLNGWMNAGHLGGRALLSGGALALSAVLGPRAVVGILMAIVGSSAVLVLLCRPPPAALRGAAALREFGANLRAAARRRSTWAGLAFALVAAAGFEAAGGLGGPFLVDRGLPKEFVGALYGGPFVAGMVIGGLAGGRASDRLGRRGAVAAGQAAFALLVLAIAGAARLRPDLPGGAAAALYAALYLAIGFYTAASYALFMSLTDPRLGATQFSAYMGATNACEAWSVNLAGRFAGALGYPVAFASMALVSLASIPLLLATGGGSAAEREEGPGADRA